MLKLRVVLQNIEIVAYTLYSIVNGTAIMMRIHFITSRPTLENDISILRKIISFIHFKDHTIVHDWIETAYIRLTERRQVSNQWPMIYVQNLEAVTQADAIIAETTYENFAVGYQIAVAIQQKKPVLLLRRATADKNAFVTGVEDGWVRHAEYTDDTIEQIVEKFLEENEINLKDMRFNFFIDRKIHNYLRWASFKTGKTKAEVVRQLLKRDIERGDY